MKHLSKVLLISSLVVLGAFSTAAAQDPDVRNIRPVIMLLVDTSGSMEWLPDCVCTTDECTECLPACGTGTGDDEKNRWALILEGLTGEWSSFACVTEDRSVLPKYDTLYDEDYFVPHHTLPNEEVVPIAQTQNGVLDVFIDRAKFGLMTFDSYSTFIELIQTDNMLQTDYELPANIARNPTMEAMWSYGDTKPYSIFVDPVDTNVYMLDNGVRNDTATEGKLVSVGVGATHVAVNAEIQEALLGTGGGAGSVRPFGATPIAGMLTDFQYYLQNNTDVNEKTAVAGPGDEFYQCRPRIGLLITDGAPNGDARGDGVGGYQCEELGNPTGATGCPFDLPEDIVQSMMDEEEMTRFYPVGFSLASGTASGDFAIDFLNDLATIGETGEADFISTSTELISVLNEIVGAVQPGAASRTAPVIGSADIWGAQQVEFLSGFRSPDTAGEPWDGVLERRSYLCQSGAALAEEIQNQDRFQVRLNAQSTRPTDVIVLGDASTDDLVFDDSITDRDRNLWTVLPAAAAQLENKLAGSGQDEVQDLGFLAPDSADYVRNLNPIELANDTIDPSFFDVADTTARDSLVNFIYGEAGTAREGHRLDAIYHSTPVLVGPLTRNTDDVTYNSYRIGGLHTRGPDAPALVGEIWSLVNRPRILYAASNDGIVHAFLADDQGAIPDGSAFSCVSSKDAGTELWGFIPPMLVNNLKDELAGHQWMTDGNLIVKEMYDVRARFATEIAGTIPEDEASETGTGYWRTVLIFGLRAGGAGFIALDITNPCQPQFLWQFTDSDLGNTYGDPALAQINISASGFQRGIAILPGGKGEIDAGAVTPCEEPVDAAITTDVEATDGDDISPRSARRCWETTGRVLYFVDIASGEILREFGSSDFMAPLDGAVSVFNGQVGELAYVAYFSDADGVLWRAEFTDIDPADWTVKAFHDMFHSGDADDGQPGFSPPLITTDPQGRVVIIHATGNVDVLDNVSTSNRVMSITEKLTFDTDGTADVSGILNWEFELPIGETNMGPLAIFSGRVFFSTFVPTTDPVNACAIGGSKIWGVSYLEDPADPGGLQPQPKMVEEDGDLAFFLDKTEVEDLENTVVTGVELTTNSACQIANTGSVFDYIAGSPGVSTPTTIVTPNAAPSFSLVTSLSGATLGESGGSVLSITQDPSQLQVESNILGVADVFD